jgi:replication factor A1
MKISELKAGSSNVTVEGVIVQKDDPREVVTKFGKRLHVANAVLKDDSGSIPMSLWGNDIETVSVGDKVEISNGYVSEFRGTPQLSTGKFGKIKVISKGDGAAADGADGADDLEPVEEDQ